MPSIRSLVRKGVCQGWENEEDELPSGSKDRGPVLPIAPGALKRREVLIKKRQEKEQFRILKSQQKAVFRSEGLALTVTKKSDAGTDSLTPRSKFRGVVEAFRVRDAARQGTVTNEDFVSVLRTFELDLGDEETLNLLQRYNVNGRTDYAMFLSVVKGLLFAQSRGNDSEAGRESSPDGSSVKELQQPEQPSAATSPDVSKDTSVTGGFELYYDVDVSPKVLQHGRNDTDVSKKPDLPALGEVTHNVGDNVETTVRDGGNYVLKRQGTELPSGHTFTLWNDSVSNVQQSGSRSGRSAEVAAHSLNIAETRAHKSASRKKTKSSEQPRAQFRAATVMGTHTHARPEKVEPPRSRSVDPKRQRSHKRRDDTNGGDASEIDRTLDIIAELEADLGMAPLSPRAHTRGRSQTSSFDQSESSSLQAVDNTQASSPLYNRRPFGRWSQSKAAREEEEILSRVRTKVATRWAKLRQAGPVFDHSLSTESNKIRRIKTRKEEVIEGLELQLEQRRVLADFQSCLSPREMTLLMGAYQDWCVSKSIEDDKDRTRRRLGASGSSPVRQLEADALKKDAGNKTWSEFLRLFIVCDKRAGAVSSVGYHGLIHDTKKQVASVPKASPEEIDIPREVPRAVERLSMSVLTKKNTISSNVAAVKAEWDNMSGEPMRRPYLVGHQEDQRIKSLHELHLQARPSQAQHVILPPPRAMQQQRENVSFLYAPSGELLPLKQKAAGSEPFRSIPAHLGTSLPPTHVGRPSLAAPSHASNAWRNKLQRL